MNYTPVIGLEIHCELLTKSKVFCACENSFGGKENTRVCPRCLGFPGTLPVLNKNAVRLAVKAGLALDCKINNYSAFDRKNYFYPDLPKAYQITQFFTPICENGSVTLENGKTIHINRIHIEEDAGKLVHDEESKMSFADYNRCGVPLIEIVTGPDFRTAEEVADFVRRVALRLKYAKVCDARMEQGSIRVDVNISVMPEGAAEFGTRAEIKNLNSLRAIARAIEYETSRQSKILGGGGSVTQETRRFDDTRGVTVSMRSKEEAHDYRYFPEPDIPPVFLTDEEIANIKNELPELPHKRQRRYTEAYGLSQEDARLITEDRLFSDFYDAAVKEYPDYKQISNLMLVELKRCLNECETGMKDLKFTPPDLAKTAQMAADGIISKNAAREIVGIMFTGGGKPEQIARERGFVMSSNSAETEMIIDKILAENEKQVTDYKNGSEKIFGFLMGKVMREIGGSANPKIVKELLTEKLKQ